MELHELLAKGATAVRRDEKLMHLYIAYFKGAFSFTPNCAGCTFKNDFQKLARWAKQQNPEKIINLSTDMENSRKYKVKNGHRNTILSFNEDGRTVRMYAFRASDSFIEKWLDKSPSDKKAERLRMFEVQGGSDLESMKRKDLDAIAEGKGLNPKDYKNKAEVIEAINGATE